MFFVNFTEMIQSFMIILIKENNGKIATFLTEWDILFDILLYIFGHFQF